MNTAYLLNDLKGVMEEEFSNKALFVAVGSGNSEPSSSDTSLDNEVFRKARQQITQSGDSITVSLWLGTSEANGNTLSEVGVFDGDASDSNLLTRDLIQGLDKTNDIEVWIDVQEDFTISQGD